MKLLLLSAFALVAIAGSPATAVVPSQFANLSSHSPSGPAPMPGMDMPGMVQGTADMPGMNHGTTGTSSQDRPLKPVLGVFGFATSAVLLGAGFLRRQDRTRDKAKQASRRNQK